MPLRIDHSEILMGDLLILRHLFMDALREVLEKLSLRYDPFEVPEMNSS